MRQWAHGWSWYSYSACQIGPSVSYWHNMRMCGWNTADLRLVAKVGICGRSRSDFLCTAGAWPPATPGAAYARSVSGQAAMPDLAPAFVDLSTIGPLTIVMEEVLDGGNGCMSVLLQARCLFWV
jgi:hypothetical protein